MSLQFMLRQAIFPQMNCLVLNQPCFHCWCLIDLIVLSIPLPTVRYIHRYCSNILLLSYRNVNKTTTEICTVSSFFSHFLPNFTHLGTTSYMTHFRILTQNLIIFLNRLTKKGFYVFCQNKL